MGKIKVAIVGVGNCASSLVQGIHYYKDTKDDEFVPGVMHVNFGGYHIGDIEVVAAFDFFTVPTLTFRTLYCFFVIEHRRRCLLHFNCTAHPTCRWIVQQLRQAPPFPCPYSLRPVP